MTRAQAIERLRKDLVDDLVRDWGAVIAQARAELADPETVFDRGLSHADCVLLVELMVELIAHIRAWEA
jgi:hypothetical protein